MTDISTSRILDDSFILKLLVRMLAVPGFLSVDAIKMVCAEKWGKTIVFMLLQRFRTGGKPLPRTKEEEIKQVKESPLRSGNHRGLYVHVAR
ncbi:MAG: hypothetical protein DWB48_08690 [Nitrosomonas sp.]|nr:hypothetical protein [Nitrosomonas sp.]